MPATYRIGGIAYLHRWWRFERPYRIVELDVEFGSEPYHAALRDYRIGCVLIASAPVTRRGLFKAIEAYQRYPPRIPRVVAVDRAHAKHVRNTVTCAAGWSD